MLLFVLLLIIVLVGLAAIEWGQASKPRSHAIWNDDAERRLLRANGGPTAWW
jgi:hypothetical protein